MGTLQEQGDPQPRLHSTAHAAEVCSVLCSPTPRAHPMPGQHRAGGGKQQRPVAEPILATQRTCGLPCRWRTVAAFVHRCVACHHWHAKWVLQRSAA